MPNPAICYTQTLFSHILQMATPPCHKGRRSPCTSSPPGRRRSWTQQSGICSPHVLGKQNIVFLRFHTSPLTPLTQLNFLRFEGFFASNFCAFPLPEFSGFFICRLFFTRFDFFSDIKSVQYQARKVQTCSPCPELLGITRNVTM